MHKYPSKYNAATDSKRCREYLACEEATTKVERLCTGAGCTTQNYSVEQRGEEQGLHFRREVGAMKGKYRGEAQNGIRRGTGSSRCHEGEEVVVHVARSMSTEAGRLGVAEQREFGDVAQKQQPKVANFS
jgi:hypothetical protein